MELVPGTTVMTNSAHPNGVTMKDVIHKNGINSGTCLPTGRNEITYQAKFVSGSGRLKIGGHVAHDSGQYNYYKLVIIDP